MEATATNQKQSTLQITGMTCAACANRIEKGLNKLEGVDSANVNFALEKLVYRMIQQELILTFWKRQLRNWGTVRLRKLLNLNWKV